MKTNIEMLSSIDEDSLDAVAGGNSGAGGGLSLGLGLDLGCLLSATVGAEVGPGVAVGANICLLGIPVNLGLGIG
jgi:hypothetical protein